MGLGERVNRLVFTSAALIATVLSLLTPKWAVKVVSWVRTNVREQVSYPVPVKKAVLLP